MFRKSWKRSIGNSALNRKRRGNGLPRMEALEARQLLALVAVDDFASISVDPPQAVDPVTIDLATNDIDDSLSVPWEAGNIEAIQNDTSNTSGAGGAVELSAPNSTPGFFVDRDFDFGGNRGDYVIRFGDEAPGDFVDFLAFSSISQTLVDHGQGQGAQSGISSSNITGDQWYYIALMDTSGAEYNSDVNVVGIPWDGFADHGILLGAVTNQASFGSGGVNNGEMSLIRSNTTPPMVLANPATITSDLDKFTAGGDFVEDPGLQGEEKGGQYYIRIPDGNGGHYDSNTDGILLATGLKNDDNYAIASPHPDGSWTVLFQDVTGPARENDGIGWAFVPNDTPLVTAGRVAGDGTVLADTAGTFTTTYLGNGQIRLEIEGGSPAAGSLITTADGIELNSSNEIQATPMANNIVNFEPDGDGWIVSSLSAQGNVASLEDVGSDPMFTFAYFPHGLQGDPIEIDSLDLNGTAGSVSIDPSRTSVTYNAASNNIPVGTSVTDTFTYTAINSVNTSETDTAVVTVTLTNPNDLPVATGSLGSVTVQEDSADLDIAIGTLFDDADLASGDVLTISASSLNAALVDASISGNTLTLSFGENQFGSTFVSILASDLSGASAQVGFRVTVTPEIDDVAGTPDSAITTKSVTSNIDVLSNDVHPDAITVLENHGFNIEVVQNDPDNGTSSINIAIPERSPGVPQSTGGAGLRSGSNRGDYNVALGNPSDDSQSAVLLTSVAENGRSNLLADNPPNDGGPGFSLATSTVEDTGSGYFIPIHATSGGDADPGIEFNINVSAEYFPIAEGAIAGHTRGAGIFGSPSIRFGQEFVRNSDGTNDLTIPEVTDPNAGVLLVNGAQNTNIYANSRANPDGTFTIFGRRNDTDGPVYENVDVSFAYIPNGLPNVISGRVNNDASTSVANGTFTVTQEDAANGLFRLSIAGHDPTSGSLIISPEGGEVENVDNIITYEPAPNGTDWLIQIRDLDPNEVTPVTPPVDLNAVAEAAFSFGFFPFDTAPTDTDLTIISVQDSSSNANVSDNGATVTLLPDGTVDYDPSTSAAIQALVPGQTLTDTFTYTIEDGRNDTATVTVSVTVFGASVAAVDDSATTTNGSSVVIGGLANDTNFNSPQPPIPVAAANLDTNSGATDDAGSQYTVLQSTAAPNDISIGGAPTLGETQILIGGQSVSPDSGLTIAAIRENGSGDPTNFRLVVSAPRGTDQFLELDRFGSNAARNADLAVAHIPYDPYGQLQVFDFQQGRGIAPGVTYGVEVGGVTDGVIERTDAWPAAGGTSSGFFDVQNDFLDAQGSTNAHAVFRFDDFIGNTPGQIPPGSQILSASFFVTTSTVGNAQSGGPYSIHEILEPWDDSARQDNFPFFDDPPEIETGDVQATAPSETGTIQAPPAPETDTAQGGDATTIVLAATADPTDDFYNGMYVEITSGAGAGQVRRVVDYDGATLTATVDADFDPVPDATSVYEISSNFTTVTLDPTASDVDNFYNGGNLVISITGGTGAGQWRSFASYDGTTKLGTINGAWDTVPDASSTYAIVEQSTTNTVTFETDASALSGFYDNLTLNDVVYIDAGTGAGQFRFINTYDGPSRTATLHGAWDTIPDETSEYSIRYNTFGLTAPNDQFNPPADVSEPLASFSNISQGQVLAVNVTDIVQDWIDGSKTNNGFGITPGTNDGWNVQFSESDIAGNRPRLRVIIDTGATAQTDWLAGTITSDGSLQDGNPRVQTAQLQNGNFHIQIPGVQDSYTEGLMFAIGNDTNDDNVASATAVGGNAWEIIQRDNTTTRFSTGENGSMGFLYLPWATANLTAGRVNASHLPPSTTDAVALHQAAGSFDLTRDAVGTYRLSIDGFTPEDGVLLLTPANYENGTGEMAFLSYQADGDDFVIQNHIQPTTELHDSDFAFAFIPFADTIRPGVGLDVTQIEGNPVNLGDTILLPSNARVTLNNDGSFSYDPNGAFDTLAYGATATDTFTYTVSDGVQPDSATATVTIVGENSLEVANPLPDLVVSQDDPDMVIDISTVFEDVDGHALTVTLDIANQQYVDATLVGDMLTLDFNHRRDGIGFITLTADDGNGGRVSDGFKVTVNPETVTRPLIEDETAATNEATPILDIDVLSNDLEKQTAPYAYGSRIDGNPLVGNATGAWQLLTTSTAPYNIEMITDNNRGDPVIGLNGGELDPQLGINFGIYRGDVNNSIIQNRPGPVEGASGFGSVTGDPIGRTGYSTHFGLGGTGELNIPVGGAWLPYDDGFLAGQFSAGYGIFSSNGIRQEDFTIRNTGLYEITLPFVEDSTADGYLFGIPTDNENNVISVNPIGGSTYQVKQFDDDTDTLGGANGRRQGEDDSFSIAYVPADYPGLIAGRIDNDGNILQQSGNWTVNASNTGEWEISIPGESPLTGSIIANVAGADPLDGEPATAFAWYEEDLSTDAGGDLVSPEFILRSGFTDDLSQPPNPENVRAQTEIQFMFIPFVDDTELATIGVSEIAGQPASVDTPVTLPSGATATLNADGTLDYDPNGAFDFLGQNEIATDTITYTVANGQGSAYTGDVVVTITGIGDVTTFQVDQFTPTPSGFDAQLNRAADLDLLNIYDGTDAPFDAPDVLVTNSGGGFVPGSITWDAATNTLSYVASGGALADGDYNVTLVSGATAFADTIGELLDGDADGNAGDDYTTTFTVANGSSAVISLPDFARGAGQPVNVPGEATGLPLTLDGAANVTEFSVDVAYDPALLNITAATAGADAAGWTITIDTTTTPGIATITGSGPAINGSDLEIVTITADVPNTAPYGASQRLGLGNVSLNSGALTVVGDEALHKAAYLGDADGDGFLTGTDSTALAQLSVFIGNGFDAHDWTDPLIVGDVDSDGFATGVDATWIAQKSVFLPRPEIPNVPFITTTPANGIDPQFQIAELIPALQGDTVTVPVMLDIEPAADGVNGVTFFVGYDPSILSITNGDVLQSDGNNADVDAAHSWTTANGWTLTANVSPFTPIGQAIAITYSRGGDTVTSATGLNHLVDLVFTVDTNAPDGVTPLDAEPANPNLGGYVWTSDDGSIQIGNNEPQELYINEVLRDAPGGDTGNEYIEIRGVPDSTIEEGTYFITVDGDGGIGIVDHIFNLSGMTIGSNGYLVLLQEGSPYTPAAGSSVVTATGSGWGTDFSDRANDLENGAITFMLIETAIAPIPDDDVDAEGDGVLDGSALNWNILDSIGVTEAPGETVYGMINFTIDDGAITADLTVNVGFEPNYVGRIGDSTGSTAGDWVAARIEGTIPALNLIAGETAPATLDNAPLDHIGATNSFIGDPNDAPVLTAVTDQTLLEGGSFTDFVVGNYTDADAGDTHTATIDWGDGSAIDTGTVDGNAGTITGSHTYADDGNYTVTVSITDGTETVTDTFDVFVDNVAPSIAVTGNAATDEGASYTVTLGAVTDPGDDTPTSYVVNWGDGASDTVTTIGDLTHTYADGPANYTIRVDVTDEDGTWSESGSLDVTVNNVAPTIALSGNPTTNEGEVYTLNLGAVTDPGTDTVTSYVINWGDGMTDTVSSAGNVTHTYADGPNSYNISVDLIDEDGTHAGAGTLAVSVNNVAPVVDAGGNQAISTGSSITLDPATFTDPGADTHTATIDWGDGSAAATGTVDQGADTVSGGYTYAAAGTYTVTVTVNDGDDSGSDTFMVTVTDAVNLPPVVTAAADQSINEGGSLTSFTVASFTDSDSVAHTATIDWGDGSATDAGSVNQAADTVSGSHTYADDGIYTVTVTVDDGDGNQATDTFTVTVANVDPTINITGAAAVDEGSAYSLNLGSVSDPGADTVSQYVVDWGDGTSDTYTSAGIQSHVYADGPNSYTISVDLVDEDGTYTDADTLAVTVNNVAPTATITGPTSGAPGDTLSFTFSATDPSATDAANLIYEIDWDNDGTVDVTQTGTSAGLTLSNTFNAFGSNTIGLTVTDPDGDSGTDLHTVTILNTGDPVVVVDGDLIVTGTGGSDRIVLSTAGAGIRVRYNNTFYGPLSVSGEARVFGLGGSDTIIAVINVPLNADGGTGNDYIAGTTLDDTLFGGEGNDILLAGEGDNTVDGGAGADRIEGRSGADLLSGGDGNDRINGGAGDDIIDGGNDNDFVFGGLGNDLIRGGSGVDVLDGSWGNDVISGGDDSDSLSGRDGQDILIGGLGSDRIRGGSGDDLIVGGASDHDDTDSALLALLAEWGSGVNAANIVNGGGANGSIVLSPATITDDGARDDLNGDTGVDYYFSGSNDRVRFRSGEDQLLP